MNTKINVFFAILTVLLVIYDGLASAQIYNGTTLTVQSGANLYFDGAAVNQTSGTIANSLTKQ